MSTAKKESGLCQTTVAIDLNDMVLSAQLKNPEILEIYLKQATDALTRHIKNYGLELKVEIKNNILKYGVVFNQKDNKSKNSTVNVNFDDSIIKMYAEKFKDLKEELEKLYMKYDMANERKNEYK